MHDIIEDTKYDYNYLKDKYGKFITNDVFMVTENKLIEDYVDRKKDFINKIKNADKNIILVELADKLQNLISDYENFLINGKDSLVIEANNYDELKWYYNELKKIFNKNLSDNKLLDRYNEIYNLYFS